VTARTASATATTVTAAARIVDTICTGPMRVPPGCVVSGRA
jgi:hypothetical protein